MAAYRAAARRFPGLHQPLVGIAMEYARMNNVNLALQCLQNAAELAPQYAPAHACSRLHALHSSLSTHPVCAAAADACVPAHKLGPFASVSVPAVRGRGQGSGQGLG